MKIDPIGSFRAKVVRRGERGQGAVGGRFTEQLADDSQTAAVDAPAPMASIDALLALQEVPVDGGGRRLRPGERGNAVLDQLDHLRIGLLMGFIPRERLAELSRLAQGLRSQATDPRLAEILGEIELRARVELAKLTQPV